MKWFHGRHNSRISIAKWQAISDIPQFHVVEGRKFTPKENIRVFVINPNGFDVWEAVINSPQWWDFSFLPPRSPANPGRQKQRAKSPFTRLDGLSVSRVSIPSFLQNEISAPFAKRGSVPISPIAAALLSFV
jgi:hypothetical protein